MVAHARDVAHVNAQLDVHTSIPRRLQQPAVEKTSGHAASLEGQPNAYGPSVVFQAKRANGAGLGASPRKGERVQAHDRFRRQKLAAHLVHSFRVAFEQSTGDAAAYECEGRQAPRGAATQHQHGVTHGWPAPSWNPAAEACAADICPSTYVTTSPTVLNDIAASWGMLAPT